MRRSALVSLCLLISFAICAVPHVRASFSADFEFADFCRNTPHCQQSPQGVVSLAVNKKSVGAFMSKSLYRYGIFSVQMKLPAGYSGGVIPCFYLISPGRELYHEVHDEIDMEFIGGLDPRNITIHTNLISGGQNKLEQFRFPFDPSAAFHAYSIIFSHNRIIWMVDNIPIRISYKTNNRPFPNLAMRVKGSIWDSSSWSALKSDFSRGAVRAHFRQFSATRGCKVPPNANVKGVPACASWRTVDKAPWAGLLTPKQLQRNREYQKRYLLKSYDWAVPKG